MASRKMVYSNDFNLNILLFLLLYENCDRGKMDLGMVERIKR